MSLGECCAVHEYYEPNFGKPASARSVEVRARSYEEQDADAWDRLVAGSWNGTFLHTRRFLSYHGDRFKDLSIVLEDDRGRITGVFPAALDSTREDVAVSHPGLTYGGVVHNGRLRGAAMVEALRAVAETYRDMGIRSLRYRVVPHIYHLVPSDDLYALFCLGAVRYRCDLSATLDLALPLMYSRMRQRNLKNAWQYGVTTAFGAEYLEPYWTVLEENLATRHSARPAHTLHEIESLRRRFPREIECAVSMVEGEVVSGVVLFRTPQVIHVQYSASTPRGNAVNAQTAIMDHVIEGSRVSGARYFDFGTSNEHEGRILNEGLHEFKVGFGAGGMVHEHYELDLERPPVGGRLTRRKA
jgi:hypothetical protein